MKKFYHEKVIDEIIGIIKDNLILKYNYDDNSLPNLKEYCKKRSNKRYQLLSNDLLIYFTEESLSELINCDFLYDFRPLE